VSAPADAARPALPDARHRFLVIGASGFVGSHLIRRLASLGIPALGTRSRSGKRPAAAPLVPFDLASDRIADVLNPGFLRQDPPATLHAAICATVDNMDACYREAAHYRRIYVDGTCRLIDDLVALGVRPVFFSTCYVFDGGKGFYSEDDPISPVNEYARQKYAVEQHLATHAPSGWTLRLDKIVGDDPTEESLFTQWLRRVRENRPITCIADSELSPTYVGDVVEAVLLSASKGLTGMHHVANPERFLRIDLARAFCRHLGVPNHPMVEHSLEDFGFADARALKSSLNGSRFQRLTGIQHTPMATVLARFAQRLPR